VLTRTRLAPVAALAVAALVVAGGCSHGYKAGTPAVTGTAPDCSAVPADLVSRTLGKQATGPIAETRPGGVACTFPDQANARLPVAQVTLTGNVDKDSFERTRENFKVNNVPVKNIGGYGDEAYAAAVIILGATNYTFAARKGAVSASITSTASEKDLKALMKELLAKL
jgi:hypothetical protein